MATISQAPVPIIAGTSTPVLPPSQSTPYGTIVCTVYNSTPNVLAVTCAGGTRYLQPNQADSYPTSSAMPIPTVSPFTTLPNGTFLGTITATFYDKNDGAPPGFPMPLTPFPGGAVLMVGSTSTVGISVSPSRPPPRPRWRSFRVPARSPSIGWRARS